MLMAWKLSRLWRCSTIAMALPNNRLLSSAIWRWQQKTSSNWLSAYQQHYFSTQSHQQAAYSGSPRASQSNYYDILGVPSDAAPSLIKARYYKLCFEFHPDRLNAQSSTLEVTAEAKEVATRAAKQKFQKIAEAYRVIGHPARRREYDNDLLSLGRRSSGLAGRSGYHQHHRHPLKPARPSETERRRWQEATHPMYRTQSGDELRNRMWRRSDWLRSTSSSSKLNDHKKDDQHTRKPFFHIDTRFQSFSAQMAAKQTKESIKADEGFFFIRRSAEVSMLLAVPVLGAVVVLSVVSRVYASEDEKIL
ncbi:DnaJ domain-containing protein [Syncephalis fuscata]|nr:DnaJ domain-containing protein [Syncephalis fuscata]